MQFKRNITPEAYSNAKWSGASWSLPKWWIIRIWGGERYLWGGQDVERSGLMGSALVSHFSVVLPDSKKLEMAIVSEDAR